MKMNLTKAKEPLIFSAGLAIGSVVTWLCVKKHYKDQARERIESVEEAYKIDRETIEKAVAAKNKPNVSVYAQSLQSSEAKEEEPEEPEAEPEETDIYEEPDEESYLYEITTSEFANYVNDRTRMTIIRFSDDVYTDELYNELNPRDYLRNRLLLLDDNTPVDPIDYIRRMTKDEICIRNFDLNLDIDICTEDRSYRDYMST